MGIPYRYDARTKRNLIIDKGKPRIQKQIVYVNATLSKKAVFGNNMIKHWASSNIRPFLERIKIGDFRVEFQKPFHVGHDAFCTGKEQFFDLPSSIKWRIGKVPKYDREYYTTKALEKAIEKIIDLIELTFFKSVVIRTTFLTQP